MAVIQTGLRLTSWHLRNLPKRSANLRNFTRRSENLLTDATDRSRVFFWTTTEMHCKHSHSQGININKVDEYVKAYHWKVFRTKIIVRLFSKLHLPDIYRLNIPTTLIKPTDDKDSVEFYVITTMIKEEGRIAEIFELWSDEACSYSLLEGMLRLPSNILSHNLTCNISRFCNWVKNTTQWIWPSGTSESVCAPSRPPSLDPQS